MAEQADAPIWKIGTRKSGCGFESHTPHQARHGSTQWPNQTEAVPGIRVCKLELYDEPIKGRLGTCSLDLRYRMGPLRYSVISMAGPAADHILTRAPRDTYSAGDAKHIRDTGLGNKELWLLRDLVHPLIRRKRGTIERVARALAKHGVLSGDELRRLIVRKRNANRR